MASTRKTFYEDDRTWIWKFILRMLTIVLAAVGIGCVAWASVTSSARAEDRSQDDFFGTLVVPWCLMALCLSILWNIANIAVLLSRNRPIAPGADIGCDLLLWLFLLGAGILPVIHSVYGEYSDSDTSLNHLQGVVEVVGSGFMFAVMLCHFALFVSACRNTRKRGQAKMTTQAAVMAGEMLAEMMKNGQLAPTQAPLSETGHEYLHPQQTLTALPVPQMQQQNSFAAVDPQVPVSQQQQQQSTFPHTNIKQPPRALSPIQDQQPNGSWILSESKPDSVVYHIATLGHDVENHQPSVEQQATMTSPPSPVSPIMSPQSPDNRALSVIRFRLSDELRS